MNIAASFALGSPTFAVVLGKRLPLGPKARAITARIAILKRRLLAGGALREVEWRRRTGEPDVRGRYAVTTTLIDAFIEQRPALDRSRIDTNRADNTVLTILDPLAIIDTDTFKWGDPPDVYQVKKVDGLVQDEETGTRYASEVTVLR